MTRQRKLVPREQIITDQFSCLPHNYYQCIVADPPWSYDNKVTGGSGISGSAAKYPTMTFDQIAGLPVHWIAAQNAILYLWITNPLKADILSSGLLKRWGFSYKTTIYWRKIMSLGLGYYFRGQVEECLICTRGEVPAFRQQTANIFQCKVGKHSEKPQEFWDSYVYPVTKKLGYDRNIELFSRSPQPGWDAFGNECGASS